MELKDYIEAGIGIKGSVTALADELGLLREALSAAKSHHRGLPDDALSKLADILGTDFRPLVAASRLVTERNEEKRAYWRPFVTNARNLSKAASYALILATVTNFVTTTPAEAAPRLDSAPGRVCIM